MMRYLLIICFTICSLFANAQSSVLKQMTTEFNRGNFPTVVKLFTNLTEKETTAEVYYMVGLSFYNMEDYPNAFLYINNAIDEGKNTADVYYYRGMTNFYMGRIRQSKQDLNAALVRDKESSYYYKEKALIYYHAKEYDTAILLLNTATALSKPDDHAFYLRGIVYTEMGLLDEALFAYSLAVQNMSPNSPYLLQCYYDIGMIEQYRGNYLESNKALFHIVNDSSTDYYSIQKIIQNFHAMGMHDKAAKYTSMMYRGYNLNLLPEDIAQYFCFEVYRKGPYNISAYENYPGLGSLETFEGFSKHIYNVYDSLTDDLLFSIETKLIPEEFKPPIQQSYKYVIVKRIYKNEFEEELVYYWEFIYEDTFTYAKLKEGVDYVLDGNHPGMGFKPYWFEKAIDWTP